MPTRPELEAAVGRAIPDLVATGLDVLFCGINPGCYSGLTGFHFARPGNRFWRVLHLAGLTERELAPSEQDALLAAGIGITNLVERTSAQASDLGAAELREGAERLEALVGRIEPRAVVVLGLGAYRVAFARPRAALGEQPERLGPARVFLVANPSGLQARYQLADLVAQVREVRVALEIPERAPHG